MYRYAVGLRICNRLVPLQRKSKISFVLKGANDLYVSRRNDRNCAKVRRLSAACGAVHSAAMVQELYGLLAVSKCGKYLHLPLDPFNSTILYKRSYGRH